MKRRDLFKIFGIGSILGIIGCKPCSCPDIEEMLEGLEEPEKGMELLFTQHKTTVGPFKTDRRFYHVGEYTVHLPVGVMEHEEVKAWDEWGVPFPVMDNPDFESPFRMAVVEIPKHRLYPDKPTPITIQWGPESV